VVVVAEVLREYMEKTLLKQQIASHKDNVSSLLPPLMAWEPRMPGLNAHVGSPAKYVKDIDRNFHFEISIQTGRGASPFADAILGLFLNAEACSALHLSPIPPASAAQ
jgi:hypothetical protein